jgi:hypothetical protein
MAISARASVMPGQAWMPTPKAMRDQLPEDGVLRRVVVDRREAVLRDRGVHPAPLEPCSDRGRLVE